jgi:hypothetical protein
MKMEECEMKIPIKNKHQQSFYGRHTKQEDCAGAGQAINIRTPQAAFCQMATNVATALEIDG